MRRRTCLAVIAGLIAIPGVVWFVTGPSAHAGTWPLVYICQQAPCSNSQEFEVSDSSANPIFSVGEYGGAAVYGDNFAVDPPNTVYNPAIILSWESPDAYADQFGRPDTCVAPAKWIEPGGTWLCEAGVWKRIGA